VGNLYVNRNTIGAVVGVQPFGGRGLSGTGPKAGGPLILRRLLAAFPLRDGLPGMTGGTTPAIMERWHAWLMGNGYSHIGHRVAEMAKKPLPGAHMTMPGPVGEENVYSFRPRGHVLCVGDVREHLVLLASLALSCGNTAFV
ncbi:trifunctional transcriptional regulator/proline dehydrogenase/L-glutamate gamma-semialdehyde dehydrogenase, partial [Novacetimonas hansenii]|nr:trifunctional transcriptional regulator/proline dehydrogenase/L-glutamate gamma-semialdehyde dehydrogenase [Novacetimonas hansenii]